MFARSLLQRVAPRVAPTTSRNMSVIAAPPQNKLSFGEYLALSLTVVLGVTAYPAWVLVNIKHYRGRE